MTDDLELPADLRAFLSTAVDSVEQVEILLRLHASEGAFNARTIGRELGMSDAIARHHLETLVARGLLQTAVGGEVFYRYAPRSPELQSFAGRLVEACRESRGTVLRFVAARPRNAMKQFSEAFRFRKDDGDR